MVKFKDFLKELNINDLKENKSIDIRDKNKKIKSYNHKTNEVEYKRILKVIRKPNCELVILKTINNNFEGTLEHKFYTNNNIYESIKEIIDKGFHNIEILTENGNFEKIEDIILTPNIIPIYDLEVEDNHNLFTNNLLSHNSYGDPTTVSGGLAIPFYAHVRIRVTRSEIDRDLRQNVMKFTVIKNKLAEAFKVGTVVYNWSEGFDSFSEIADLAIEFEVIKVEGKTYYFPEVEDFKVIGKKNAIQYLKDNEEYTRQIVQPLVTEILNGNNLRKEELTEEVSN